MTTAVMWAVLFAALLHASWNALVKFGHDRLMTMAVIAIFAGLLAVIGLPFVPMPKNEAWFWLILSVLFHIGYVIYLSKAYNLADFGQVYPIARGLAPLVILCFSALFLSELPPLLVIFGVLILLAGIVLLGGGTVKAHQYTQLKGMGYALITALFIAAYTLADGFGGRANTHAVGYSLWLFALNGVVMLIIVWLKKREKWWHECYTYWHYGMMGGLMQLGAYTVAIWAMTQAPIALVAALRETSVLFAIIIATGLLREKLSLIRVCASILVVIGVIVTKLG